LYFTERNSLVSEPEIMVAIHGNPSFQSWCHKKLLFKKEWKIFTWSTSLQSCWHITVDQLPHTLAAFSSRTHSLKK